MLLAAIMMVGLAVPAQASPFSFPKFAREGFGTTPPPPTNVSAPTWILYDANVGAVLAEHNSHHLRAPASITKIMTVLLALEHGNQNDLVTISQRAADTGEREIGLWAGETVRLGALLRAAMIHSANDAATAIAEHIGGSVENFLDMMNERSRELGMTRTNWGNPHGLDVDGHVTTAEDMLRLGLAAMEREDMREIVKARVLIFPNAPNGNRRTGTASNLMLGDFDGTSGVKTGFTGRAMFTFVASAERDGREIYAVVLGSEGRRGHFADVSTLFNYGFEGLHLYGALGGQPYQSRMITREPSPVVTASEMEALVHVTGQGLFDVEFSEDMPEPVPVAEITQRQPDPPPGFWGSVMYWVTSLVGN